MIGEKVEADGAEPEAGPDELEEAAEAVVELELETVETEIPQPVDMNDTR